MCCGRWGDGRPAVIQEIGMSEAIERIGRLEDFNGISFTLLASLSLPKFRLLDPAS